MKIKKTCSAACRNKIFQKWKLKKTCWAACRKNISKKKTCWAACRVRHRHRQQPLPSRLQLSSARAGTPSCKWTIVLKTIHWIIGKKRVVFWSFAKPVHLCYDRGSRQIAYIPFVCFNQSSNTTTAFFPDVSCMAGLQLPIFKCLLTVQFTNRPLPSVFVCC